jgi:hypothetical protein
MEKTVIAQSDHPYMFEWLVKAETDAGGFLSTFARAALLADDENYAILRPALSLLREKYKQYEPSEEAKAKLRETVEAWRKGNWL